MCQDPYVPHGKCSKTQNARGAQMFLFAVLLSHNSLAECSTKKDKNTFSRSCGVWLQQRAQEPMVRLNNKLHIHIPPPPIIEYMHPKWLATLNDYFSFIVMNCDICLQKSWVCKHFCEKRFSCRQPTLFSAPEPKAHR